MGRIKEQDLKQGLSGSKGIKIQSTRRHTYTKSVNSRAYRISIDHMIFYHSTNLSLIFNSSICN